MTKELGEYGKYVEEQIGYMKNSFQTKKYETTV